MAAALWAPLGTLLAVAVNQPIVALVHEARPSDTLTGILVLATPTTDSGFPSDHATMAGAVTAGLFLVNRKLGLTAGPGGHSDGVQGRRWTDTRRRRRDALTLNWGLVALALTLVLAAVLTARPGSHPYLASTR